MKGFLISILGENWKKRFAFIISCYLLVFFWPVILFFFYYKKINFDPAVFTQEWLIAVSNITIIYMILEYQKYILELHKKENFCIKTLNRKLLNPLKQLVSICPYLKSIYQKDLKKFKMDWSAFYKEAISIDMYSFDVEFANQAIFNFKELYKLDAIDDVIQDIEDEDFVKTININDLHDNLNNLMQMVNTEINNLK